MSGIHALTTSVIKFGSRMNCVVVDGCLAVNVEDLSLNCNLKVRKSTETAEPSFDYYKCKFIAMYETVTNVILFVLVTLGVPNV